MSKQRASGQRSTTSGTDAARDPDTPTDAIARARGMVELLRASADRIEAARALPADIVAALHEARLFRLLLPRSLGGDELHLKTLAQVIEVIAGADASTAWCMGQGAGCAMAAASLKPEVARRLFGPADAVLAWGAGIQGKATRGGRRLSRHRQMDLRQRLRQRDAARRPQLRLREGRHAPQARRWQPRSIAPSSSSSPRPRSTTCGTRSASGARRATPMRSKTCSCPRRRPSTARTRRRHSSRARSISSTRPMPMRRPSAR